jgi:hypothetical protein
MPSPRRRKLAVSKPENSSLKFVLTLKMFEKTAAKVGKDYLCKA